jgi:hypothetical protein
MNVLQATFVLQLQHLLCQCALKALIIYFTLKQLATLVKLVSIVSHKQEVHVQLSSIHCLDGATVHMHLLVTILNIPIIHRSGHVQVVHIHCTVLVTQHLMLQHVILALLVINVLILHKFLNPVHQAIINLALDKPLV